MSVNENSKQAYKAIKDLGDNQRLVYYQIKGAEAKGDLVNCADIAEALGWTSNRVTGRIDELRNYGWIKVHGRKLSKFNRTTDTYCTSDPFAKKQLEHHFNLEEEEPLHPHYFGVANG